jgi:hypothetical protein
LNFIINNWEIISGLLVALGGMIGFFITKNIEFKKEFWAKQYENYERVLELASTITVSEDLDSVQQEIKEYRQYYWGKLAMIEDQNVFNAMIKYNSELKFLEGSEGTDFLELQNRTYDLARACRLSLKKTWSPVRISDLKKEKI